MSIACLDRQRHPMSPKSTLGRIPSSKLAPSHAAAVINHETSHVQNKEASKKSIRVYAMHHRNRQNGRSAELWIAHRNGSKASGANAQLLAAKMERESEKFTARKLALTGKKTIGLFSLTLGLTWNRICK